MLFRGLTALALVLAANSAVAQDKPADKPAAAKVEKVVTAR